ncbi:MAG: response regulator [Halobacteriovoraceae bacterium]|nr:response regulator [Halobacteriovoraceae bacterium]
MNILIVDDSKFALKRLAEMILAYNSEYKISMALDGIKGLEILKKQKFDLVISDYNMPEMNGIDFIKEAIHEYDVPKTAIISASSAYMTGKQRVPDGVFYIQKPISQEQITNFFDKNF